MVNFKPWPRIAHAYQRSFDMLKKLHCDVFLGPQAKFFDMETEARLLESKPAKNPFIDADGFQQYIASFEKSYKEQMNRERQE